MWINICMKKSKLSFQVIIHSYLCINKDYIFYNVLVSFLLDFKYWYCIFRLTSRTSFSKLMIPPRMELSLNENKHVIYTLFLLDFEEDRSDILIILLTTKKKNEARKRNRLTRSVAEFKRYKKELLLYSDNSTVSFSR